MSGTTFESLVKKCKDAGGKYLFKSFEIKLVERQNQELEVPETGVSRPRIRRAPQKIIHNFERATEQNSRMVQTKDDALVKDDGSI